MYAKGKGSQMPSAEIQAKEKLAIYVHEYLLHVGAKNSAQTFLQEIRWEKGINIGESPGFLVSWWSVFWDLYCAASPDRREQFEPSNEAKAFHDYSQPNMQQQQQVNNASLMQGMPNNNQQVYQRYHPGSRTIRIQSNVDFNSNNNPNVNNQMANDQSRVPPGMSPLSRLTPPGNRIGPPIQQQVQQQQAQNIPNQNQMGGFNPNINNNQNPSLRASNSINQQNQPASQQQQLSSAPMSPMSMSIQQQPQQQARWNPNAQGQPALAPPPPPPHAMNYSSSSPVSYVPPGAGGVGNAGGGGGNGGVSLGHHGPSTPIIPSPQDSSGELNFNLIKNVHDQNLNHIVPLNAESAHHTFMNSDIIDIKHSPISNLPNSRHQEDHTNSAPMNDLNSYNHFGDGSGGLF